jgi:hypothetical protein
MPTSAELRGKYQLNLGNPRGLYEKTIDLNGQITTDNNRRLRLEKRQQMKPKTGQAFEYFLSDLTKTNERGAINENKVAELLTILESMSYPGGHQAAKLDGRWQQLYHRSPRRLFYMDNHSNVLQYPAPGIASYPCHYCGVILPEEEIDIDHRQPQTAPAGILVAKSFHSIGGALTVSSASGEKNPQVVPINRGVAVVPVAPKGWPRGNPWQAHAFVNPKTDRYTLTQIGITVLTVASFYYGSDRLRTMCQNNLINLVPACGICNRSKTNTLHAHK